MFAEGVGGFGEGAAGVWSMGSEVSLVGRWVALRDGEGGMYRPCRRLGSRICLLRCRLKSSGAKACQRDPCKTR